MKQRLHHVRASCKLKKKRSRFKLAHFAKQGGTSVPSMPPPDFTLHHTSSIASQIGCPSEFSTDDLQIAQQLNEAAGKRSLSFDFSDSKRAKSAPAQPVLCTPGETQQAVAYPSPAPSASCPSIQCCSKHGWRGSWTIAEFCEECDRLAVARVATS